MAHAAARQLKSSFDGQVELVTTDYAGHARAVAETWASHHLEGTIIGIGGDGTINEIGNGILAATAGVGSRVVLVVCGGGNANDQYRSWPPSQRIRSEGVLSAAPVPVDVLEVSYSANNREQATPQYALSYAAIGALATGLRGQPSPARDARQSGAHPADAAAGAAGVRGDRRPSHPCRQPQLAHHPHDCEILPRECELATRRRADGSRPVPHRRWPTALRMSWFGLRALVWPHRPSRSANMILFWEQGGAAQLDGETVDIPPRSDVTVRCIPAALRMLCCDIDAFTKTRSSTASAN